MRFRQAVTTDISKLMQWIDSAASCNIWGGPTFEYPFTFDTFQRDMKWSSIDSYSLVDEQDELIGFGQLYEKLNRCHLARIIINPERRGNRHSTTLLTSLIDEGRKSHPEKECSLYVYKHNTVALHCYRGMGFRDYSLPAEDTGFDDCIFMVLKPGKTRERTR